MTLCHWTIDEALTKLQTESFSPVSDEDCSEPESRIVEGVQAGWIRPPDGAAFAAQLHVPPRSQSGGLAQPHKAALIEDLGQKRLAPPSSLLGFGRLNPHPLASRPAAVLSCLLPPLGLLTEPWTDTQGGGAVRGANNLSHNHHATFSEIKCSWKIIKSESDEEKEDIPQCMQK